MTIASATSSPLTAAVDAAFEEIRAEMRSVAGEIHGLAETGFQEFESSRLLAGMLEAHDFSVSRGAAGLDTAFIADRGEGGPRVAFVCEYDALPGIGHACGHNLIGTGSAGAGIALSEALRSLGVAGSVRVVGSPAEEGGGGKIPLCDAGVFDDCDAALIFHPSDRSISVMWALACTHWHWSFSGRAAHAASDPDQGLNALDAFVLAYNGISLWRQQLRDGSRVHGCILEGGTAPNVIPERTSGQFLTRARDGAYLVEMNRRFRTIFEGAAASTGCSLELRTEGPDYLDIRSNPVLAERCHQHLAAVGLEPEVSIPWDRVGSTDVGNLSYAVPSLHPEVAIIDAGVSCHTHEFREAADSERGYDALVRGAAALALTGADVVTDAGVRAAVVGAFRDQPWRRAEWRGSGS